MGISNNLFNIYLRLVLSAKLWAISRIILEHRLWLKEERRLACPKCKEMISCLVFHRQYWRTIYEHSTYIRESWMLEDMTPPIITNLDNDLNYLQMVDGVQNDYSRSFLVFH